MGRLAPLGVLTGIIGLWEGLVRFLHTPVYVLPPPSLVAATAWAHRSDLVADAAVTAAETIVGFGLGIAAGYGAALVFVYSRLAEVSLYPLAIGLKTMPVVAIAPILIIWLGPGMASKAVVVALICFFPALVNGLRGLRATSRELRDYLGTVGAKPLTILRYVRIPQSLPFLFSGMRIAATYAVVGAIVAEFAGAADGVGFAILVATYYIDTPLVFAYLFVASALGFSLFRLVVIAERLLIPWKDAQMEDDG